MKKIFISFILFAVVTSLPKKADAAACNVINLYFSIKNFTPTGGGGCTYLVDIGFDIEHNGGNKYIYTHLWLGANYPSWGGTYASGPTAADLNSSNAIGTIQIDVGTPDVISIIYKPGGAPVMLNGTLTKTTVGIYDRYLISNVTLTFASCPSALTIKGDIWASQSGAGKVVHCINGGLNFVPPATDFNLIGQLFCSNISGTPPLGREYNVQMTSTNIPGNALTVSYKVYVDNGNGTYLTSEETQAATFSGISLYSGNNYNGGRVDYLPYSNTPPHMNRDIWIHATVLGPAGLFEEIRRLINSCIPVPVKLSSFSAKRSNSFNVNLAWQTLFEHNNSGFELQRNVNGSWETINFITTKARGGNSNDLISYTYIDLNSTKVVSQYRIKNVDLDGKFTYSDIRTVRGDGATIKTIIFPNPSSGIVNVLLEDNELIRDVILTDMKGQVINKWDGIPYNSLQIKNLVTGTYLLRVTIRETGESSIEKIIINRR